MAKASKKYGLITIVQLVMAFAAGFLVSAFWHTQTALDEASRSLGDDHEVQYVSPSSKTFLEASPKKDQSHTTVTTSLPSTVVAIGVMTSLPSVVAIDKKPNLDKPMSSHYWNYCGGESSCPILRPYGGAELPADEQFLLFDTRGAGWNNDRQSLELGFALAFVWRRTLVLPEWLGNPCDPNILEHVNHTYDIEAMSAGLKVISTTEFIDYAKAHPQRFPGGAEAVARLAIKEKSSVRGTDWRKFDGWLSNLEGVALKLFTDINEVCPFVTIGAVAVGEELRKIQDSWQFRHFAGNERAGRKPLALNEEQARATALYIGPRKLLGNFYTMIFVPDPMIGWQLRNTVRRALHLHPQFFRAAAAALQVAGLSPGKFGAIHNRQGDFQQAYKDFWFDPKNPQRFLKQPQNLQFLQKHGRVYMAIKGTPSQMKDLRTIFFPALRNIMPQPKVIVTLDNDKVRDAAKTIVGHIKGWQGIVDMVICAQGEEFMGSWGSTFTGYIHRLRGYMPFVSDKRLLYTDSAKDGVFTESPSWDAPGVNSGMISWMREWPEGFQT